jgi:hypothetical protein
MIPSTQDLAVELLIKARDRLPADFSGLGIVFYEHLDCLPFLPLNVLAAPNFSLPRNGIDQIASALAEISSYQSQWHDGFHFVDILSRQLTHVSQYLSPPLTHAVNKVISAEGARQMTAILSTMISGVSGVGLLTYARELSYFESGKQILLQSAL